MRAGVIALVMAGGAVGVWWFAIREPEDALAVKHDPIEDDPRLKPMIAEADREAARQLAEFRSKRDPPGTPRLGDCHLYWAVKKDFLREKYGIEWRTPGEMNPGIAFD